MSNRVFRGGLRGRNEIQVELRASVVNGTVRFLRERVPKVIGADAKALAAERLGQAVHASLTVVHNHVHVGRRPRDPKGSHCESAHEDVIHPRCTEGPLRRLNDGDE